MVNGASSLIIKGTIDTKDMERGFARINVGFDNVKGKAKSFNSDLIRMNISAGTLAKRLANVAAVGATALIGLAKNAPAVAPAMAKIGVQLERFQRTLGKALQPQFEQFSDAFQKFVDFADAHPDILSGFVLTGAALGGIKALTALLGITVGPTLLTALALLGTFGFLQTGLEKEVKGAQEKFGIETPITEKIEESGAPFSRVVAPFVEAVETAFGIFDKTGERINLLENIKNAKNEDDRKSFILQYADSVWG